MGRKFSTFQTTSAEICKRGNMNNEFWIKQHLGTALFKLDAPDIYAFKEQLISHWQHHVTMQLTRPLRDKIKRHMLIWRT